MQCRMADSTEENQASVDQTCYFNCGGDKTRALITAGRTRIINVVACSKLRGDGLHVELEQKLLSCDGSSCYIVCHKSCVSSYTSKGHLKRLIFSKTDADVAYEQPPKRVCRSALLVFNFRQHCLFCGDDCDPEPEQRHPDRWRRVVKCSTADHGYCNVILSKPCSMHASLVRMTKLHKSVFDCRELSAISMLQMQCITKTAVSIS